MESKRQKKATRSFDQGEKIDQEEECSNKKGPKEYN